MVIHLTLSEAAELRDSLESLLTETKSSRHEHVSSEDYKKEITILISEEKITEETGGSSGVRSRGSELVSGLHI